MKDDAFKWLIIFAVTSIFSMVLIGSVQLVTESMIDITAIENGYLQRGDEYGNIVWVKGNIE